MPVKGFAGIKPVFTANVITSFKRCGKRLTVAKFPDDATFFKASIAIGAANLEIG